MTKNVVITVKTPVGLTHSRSIGMTVGQGTSNGSIISENNLAEVVKEYFDTDVTLTSSDSDIDRDSHKHKKE